MKRGSLLLMKANYHTHTTRCQHAQGTDEQYILSAIKAGFDILGFADHTPWPYKSGFVSDIRMGVNELPGYAASISGLREKYRGEINVFLGLECEYFPRYMGWLKEAKAAYGLDYIIFGAHYYDTEEESPYVGTACVDNAMMFRYADTCVAGMDTGLYTYLAHPDLFMRHRRKWDADCEAVSRAICQKALDMHLPLEYNLNADVLRLDKGISGFPRLEFWAVAAQTGNDVIIGYDAHQPSMLENSMAENRIRDALSGLHIKPMDDLPYLR